MSLTREPVQIPRYIDDPPQFLFWQLDEVMPVAVFIAFGMITSKMTVCLAVGVVISQYWKKFRNNHPDGYALHMLYWSGVVPRFLMGGKSHLLPDSLDREYLP